VPRQQYPPIVAALHLSDVALAPDNDSTPDCRKRATAREKAIGRRLPADRHQHQGRELDARHRDPPVSCVRQPRNCCATAAAAPTPALRLTRGQRKRWLHLRADWTWTDEVIDMAGGQRPAPTDLTTTHTPTITEEPPRAWNPATPTRPSHPRPLATNRAP